MFAVLPFSSICHCLFIYLLSPFVHTLFICSVISATAVHGHRVQETDGKIIEEQKGDTMSRVQSSAVVVQTFAVYRAWSCLYVSLILKLSVRHLLCHSSVL